LRGSEATAYAIADNRTAELAEWDEGALAEQLAALQIDDEALASATGFDASEIERMALPDFQPVGIDEQGRLDEKAKVECPECGHEFTP
jgi:ParB-like chromosome segregation protein Spo0J